jgi:sodium/hydrogen antiporter
MGVGAVFISTLALTRLPEPHDPPQNQQELLAATLQPIVSFVVLGSILIRMYYHGQFECFVLIS